MVSNIKKMHESITSEILQKIGFDAKFIKSMNTKCKKHFSKKRRI
jgi:hypothetical protein